MPRTHDATGRRKGEARHVRLYHWLLDCPAWQSLSPAARCAYLELKFIYNGGNNGRIGLSARRLGACIHVSKNTAARALRELQEKGFIERVTAGAFHRKVRHATEWRLTEEKCDVSGALPTKAFMRWGQEKKTRCHQRDSRSHQRDTHPEKTPSDGSTGSQVGPKGLN
jgi:DNA-binding HxlR family transcriptional regulator